MLLTQVSRSAYAILNDEPHLDEMASDWRNVEWRPILDQAECIVAGPRDLLEHRTCVNDTKHAPCWA